MENTLKWSDRRMKTMLNGITDVIATVSVPKPEYEELVRDSEQLAVVRRMVRKNKYIGQEDLKAVLDIEESQKKEGEE